MRGRGGESEKGVDRPGRSNCQRVNRHEVMCLRSSEMNCVIKFSSVFSVSGTKLYSTNKLVSL